MDEVAEAPRPSVPALPPALAIVAGGGVLPRLIAVDQKRRGLPYRVVQFDGVEIDWAADHPVIRATFEKPGRLFADLRSADCRTVSFAGGLKRPRLNPLKFDFKGLRLAPTLFAAMKAGDDETLRIVTGIFEKEGFSVRAPHELLEELLAQPGVPTAAKPDDADETDAARAAEIVRALGAVDVGQGAVVAQGICLATETIQGTDKMLEFVARTGTVYRPDPEGAKGVLLKAPKPGQDWRVDLPAIGPETMRQVAAAGLAGIAVEAGGVLILGLEETVAEADRLGLFLWGRPKDGGAPA